MPLLEPIFRFETVSDGGRGCDRNTSPLKLPKLDFLSVDGDVFPEDGRLIAVEAVEAVVVATA